ncbi:hypothetical protein AGOR_G00100460 [Albula goreensis]|uniref:Uncharacterized protein n=1 Tax=Albula goreensis TaxID=1534307 RepID=A0A8T3DLR2_9TELE|nr:hypothetical protein AGOR_G00100460 [Albula goreensis]
MDDDEDDILDLAGGARDAIERHKASLPRFEDPPKYTYSDFPTSDPEPAASKPEAEYGFGSFMDSTEKKTKPIDEIADTETPKAEPVKESSSSGKSSPCE